MSLRLYNTLSGEKEHFEPRVADTVTMYVCGPTVYNLAHIGNARPVVVFDTLFRVLRERYATVTYARNITDIDDKIIAAARDSGRSIESVTDEFTLKYREDMAALNTLPPTLEPHATHNIDAMIRLTQRLIERGHAYVSAGHALFAVESMPEYGALSGRRLDDMLAGARVDVADYKRHPGDFVLWKPAADDEPGWDSPWGRGRPGWHLECSAMIREHLGDSIDIHGGGRDLIFPHHENEIAQSRCSHDGEFVRYWLHNAYVDIDGEKMSKSLGNVRSVRDLLQHYRGEVLRLALLTAHYRSPLNFSSDLLDQARHTLDGFYTTLRSVEHIEPVGPVDITAEPVFAALEDDLNTPLALAELHALAKALHKALDAERPRLKARFLAAADSLGILQATPASWLQDATAADELDAAAIEQLIEQRRRAKQDRDYALADTIRNELMAAGIALEDTAEGTLWRRGA
ncbi:cysteine--tRNA ligase [Chromatocurvus halotolerans]|uniref:Cysteine--tRNA ligase n=1 Tax=Chromatocurvus halotolerans TaxID=1132028 RepID=A0A4R2KWP0_9GAMM|nr:cysteine--tRNA ligase [Chromatocurvus halotolerans]TCO75689.1 cysteinyl-tRNA synthetase [Chromatocurvus halotolerans]